VRMTRQRTAGLRTRSSRSHSLANCQIDPLQTLQLVHKSYVDGPACKGFEYRFGDLVGCSHMSGPLVRRIWPLALMEFRGSGPYQDCALMCALIYSGLPNPRLDRFAITSSSPSQSCGPYGRFRPLARRSLLLDSRPRAPLPPRRCGRFGWRARPPRAWPACAPASRAPIRRP
jgi:hypothetical protein